MNSRIGLFVICAIIFISCNCTKKKVNKDITLDIWKLQTIAGKNIATFKVAQHPILTLDKEKMQFYGNNGCNSIFGKLKTYTENRLEIGAINSTRISCGNMETPYKIESLLKKVSFYEMNTEKLILKDTNKTILLTFSLKKE
ncbi:MAG: META domain-containing protein [Flavobacteriaceae bacterium]|nr:META domain-containing protein [Flavobacteriaceae bacterium]